MAMATSGSKSRKKAWNPFRCCSSKSSVGSQVVERQNVSGPHDAAFRGACNSAESALASAAPGQYVALDPDCVRALLVGAGSKADLSDGSLCRASPSSVATRSPASLSNEASSFSPNKSAAVGRGAEDRETSNILYLVDPKGCVLILKPEGKGKSTWMNSRFPKTYTGFNVRLFYGPDIDASADLPDQFRKRGWIAYQFGGEDKGRVIVEPAQGTAQDRSFPPLGDSWVFWKSKTEKVPGWRLTSELPAFKPLQSLTTIDLPYCKYVATMIEPRRTLCIIDFRLLGAVPDDGLEYLLRTFSENLWAAAADPNLRIIMKMDMQDAQLSWSQAMRFLKWVDEVQLAFMLTIRGNAIQLDGSTWAGSAVKLVVNFVLKRKPPPWETRILPTAKEADDFLASLRQELEQENPEITGVAGPILEQKASTKSSSLMHRIRGIKTEFPSPASTTMVQVEQVKQSILPAELDTEPENRNWTPHEGERGERSTNCCGCGCGPK